MATRLSDRNRRPELDQEQDLLEEIRVLREGRLTSGMLTSAYYRLGSYYLKVGKLEEAYKYFLEGNGLATGSQRDAFLVLLRRTEEMMKVQRSPLIETQDAHGKIENSNTQIHLNFAQTSTVKMNSKSEDMHTARSPIQEEIAAEITDIPKINWTHMGEKVSNEAGGSSELTNFIVMNVIAGNSNILIEVQQNDKANTPIDYSTTAKAKHIFTLLVHVADYSNSASYQNPAKINTSGFLITVNDFYLCIERLFMNQNIRYSRPEFAEAIKSTIQMRKMAYQDYINDCSHLGGFLVYINYTALKNVVWDYERVVEFLAKVGDS